MAHPRNSSQNKYRQNLPFPESLVAAVTDIAAPVTPSRTLRVRRPLYIHHLDVAAQLDGPLAGQIQDLRPLHQGPDGAVLGGEMLPQKLHLRVPEADPGPLRRLERLPGPGLKGLHERRIGRIELLVPQLPGRREALPEVHGRLAALAAFLEGGVDGMPGQDRLPMGQHHERRHEGQKDRRTNAHATGHGVLLQVAGEMPGPRQTATALPIP